LNWGPILSTDREHVSSTGPLADTEQRSLEHWSELKRLEMEHFYELATEDYRQLVLAADWRALLLAKSSPAWRLLDVACGSGKFPTALLRHADLSGLPSVAYDLLDPSSFSIREARAQLRPPFVAGREMQTTLQDLPLDAGQYDVVWATHALYAIAPDEVPVAAERMFAALRPGGLGVVAQATSRSHYLTFYDAYRAAGHPATPYSTAEQVRDGLQAAGATVNEQRITYSTGTADRKVAEGFLQRCAFDDSLSLEQMEAAPVLGDYLAGCRAADGSYSFSHEVSLLWF
jgi:SAM-dependent methyltransferase